MPIQCRKCGRSNFRLSKLHRFDLRRLLLFHVPVRCRVCHHRGYTSILHALEIAGEPKPVARVRRADEGAESILPSRCKCGRANFRLSRFRIFDLKYLVKLKYPVRCRICHSRGYTSLLHALAMMGDSKTPRRVRRTPSMARSGGPFV